MGVSFFNELNGLIPTAWLKMKQVKHVDSHLDVFICLQLPKLLFYRSNILLGVYFSLSY